MDIEKLYFGICEIDVNSGRLSARNLFDNLRVQKSIAIYRSLDTKNIKDPIFFCFGDVSGRVEYEMRIAPVVFTKNSLIEDCEKTDIYKMYVLPNKEYLMNLVNEVSEKSAKRWLKKHKF